MQKLPYLRNVLHHPLFNISGVYGVNISGVLVTDIDAVFIVNGI